MKRYWQLLPAPLRKFIAGLRGLPARLRQATIDLVGNTPARQRHKWLRQFITDNNGFFIEAGANDGVSQSNTLFLERRNGWTGLLIEPMPLAAKQCRRKRPKCITIEAALVPPGHSGEAIQMTYANLMSVVDEAIPDATERSAHLSAAKPFLAHGEDIHSVSVIGATISELLDKHGVTAIDFLSLDVEGFEAPALQGLDLERHAPKWMLIEARHRQQVDDLLLPRYDVVATTGEMDVLYRLR